MNKPKNMPEYVIWLKSICKSKNLFLLGRTDYNNVAAIIKKDFEESELWSQLNKNLNEYNDEYLKSNSGYSLLMYPREPRLLIKPYDSFLLKTFRENVLENESWPKAPGNGWILPNNWFSKINDIVRTMFVVKYIDGVEFIKNKIECLCKENNRKYIYSLKAKEEGYYAGHLHITEEIEIPEIPWGTKKVDVSIEIKITTQLKEVIQKLLHHYYENERKEIKINKKNGVPWQWDYRSINFTVNYLGHIIHYIEGVIINAREE